MPGPGQERAGEAWQDGYDLSIEQTVPLTEELLAQYEIDTDERFICLPVKGDSRFARIGHAIERTRFEQYFDNDSRQMRKEYGPYEHASKFFITIDRENNLPTGVLRVIKNSPAGLKTVNDITGRLVNVTDEDSILAAHGMDNFDNCWDICTVAVTPGYGRGAASIQLYRAMYLAALDEGADHLVSVVDKHAHRQLVRYLGVPFVPLADTRSFAYLGSGKSRAVYGHVPDFYETMSRPGMANRIRRRLAAKALDQLVDGTGDAGIFLHPEEFVNNTTDTVE